jgi:hypothetical protein
VYLYAFKFSFFLGKRKIEASVAPAIGAFLLLGDYQSKTFFTLPAVKPLISGAKNYISASTACIYRLSGRITIS